MKRVLSFILLAIMLMTATLCLIGCEEKEPYFEIRLYDKDWVELTKRELAPDIFYYKDYIEGETLFVYDGSPKVFNAKAYMNGVEFCKFDGNVTSSYYTEHSDIWVSVRDCSNRFDNGSGPKSMKDMPTEVGEYEITFSFPSLANMAQKGGIDLSTVKNINGGSSSEVLICLKIIENEDAKTNG